MNFENFNGGTMWHFGDDADDRLVAVMDEHLPEGWKRNPDHRRQVYRVVKNFLKTPRSLDIEK